MRDSVLFYRSFWEAIKKLPESDQLETIKAIMDYGLDDIDPDVTGVASAMFAMAKPQIDANNRRYQNGIKGGRPKDSEKPKDNQDITETKPKDNQDITIKEPKEKENVKENVKDKDRDRDNTRFTPPTLENVIGYCRESGYEVDAQRFIDFYVSKGWVVGKNKMKDWKAAVRNWARQEKTVKSASAQPKKNQFHNFDQRDYDYDKLLKQLQEAEG